MYQRALSYQPHRPWLNFNYSLCLLAMGNLISGFERYEYRWLTTQLEKKQNWLTPETFNIETMQGKSILIIAEQGLGDCIFLFSFYTSINHFRRSRSLP